MGGGAERGALVWKLIKERIVEGESMLNVDYDLIEIVFDTTHLSPTSSSSRSSSHSHSDLPLLLIADLLSSSLLFSPFSL